MSSYSDFANAASDILERKGAAQARAKEQGGQIWGSTIANLGQVVPQQVQQVMQQVAAKKKTAQIQQILQQAGPDLHAAIPQLRALDPTLALSFEKELNAADEVKAKADELKAKHDKEARDFQLNVLSTATNPSQYASGLKGLKDAGFDVSIFDPEYSTEAVKRANALLMNPEQRGKAVERKTANLTPGMKSFDLETGKLIAENPYQLTPDQIADNERQAANQKATQAERDAANERLTAGQAETARHNRAMESRQAAAAGAQAADITQLTPKGLEVAALNYKKTGVMPPLGMGDRTTRQRIINRAAELTPADIARIEAGGQDIAGNKADYKADSTSLTALTKQRDSITAFENTAKKNIDLFLDSANKVVDTGIPLLNTPARWIAGAGGSADMAKYNAARQVAISEIAKIVQNPNLTGQLSDSARHEIEVFNPSNATLRQTVAVMNLLKQDMANRKNSLETQLKETRGRIGGGTVAAPADPLGIR